MIWTDQAIAQLKLLWAEGHTCAEIGERMGISKNAVAGKMHRLVAAPAPKPAAKPKRHVVRAHVLAAPPSPAAPAPRSTVSPLPPESPRAAQPGPRCQFALNDVRPYRFCDQPAIPGTAWCEKHAGLVYERDPLRNRAQRRAEFEAGVRTVPHA